VWRMTWQVLSIRPHLEALDDQHELSDLPLGHVDVPISLVRLLVQLRAHLRVGPGIYCVPRQEMP